MGCEHLSVSGDADAAGPPEHTLNRGNASDYLRRAVKKYLAEKTKSQEQNTKITSKQKHFSTLYIKINLWFSVFP